MTTHTDIAMTKLSGAQQPLAHNLGRWTGMIGLPDQVPRTAATRRRRLLEIPGRLTRSARQWTLHLPARWPWRQDFTQALERVRALPAV